MSGNDGQETTADRKSANPIGTKGYTGNPGGQPKWMREFREKLKGLAPDTEAFARRVLERALDTEALQKIVDDTSSSDEARLAAEKAIATRVDQGIRMTAEVWPYILTKPTSKAKMEVKMENPLAGLSAEQIQQIASGTFGGESK